MPYAPIPMIPGPVTVSANTLAAMACDYGSGQVEADFLQDYATTGHLLATLMGTQYDVVIMTGEGMLALWAGLKSCLQPQDRVLTIATGVFGDGIGDMAASFGCDVHKVSFAFNQTIHDLERIENAIRDVRPTMITAVHCETPSGTLNPLEELGKLKKQYGVPLLYVDAVASVGGAPVCMDAWNIDLLLGGSQKCLSVPPSLSFLGISPTAWEYIKRRNYQGYDALLPWQTVQQDKRCPYTPYWHGIKAMQQALHAIMNEGIEAVFQRHIDAAQQCRTGLEAMGVALWPEKTAQASPTVTAAYIPQGYTWPQWQQKLRERGLIVAGSFGPMAGKVFRLGHMGNQADTTLIRQALEVIKDAI